MNIYRVNTRYANEPVNPDGFRSHHNDHTDLHKDAQEEGAHTLSGCGAFPPEGTDVRKAAEIKPEQSLSVSATCYNTPMSQQTHLSDSNTDIQEENSSRRAENLYLTIQNYSEAENAD